MSERLPLTFPDAKTYGEFRGLLGACFHSEGITDAVVLQIGSAVNGWELQALGSHWHKRLPGTPEFRFMLCLSAEPLVEGPFMNPIFVLPLDPR